MDDLCFDASISLCRFFTDSYAANFHLEMGRFAFVSTLLLADFLQAEGCRAGSLVASYMFACFKQQDVFGAFIFFADILIFGTT